jgi:hypothetical protein
MARYLVVDQSTNRNQAITKEIHFLGMNIQQGILLLFDG